MTRPPAKPSDSKPAFTPKLRFPEFRRQAAWESVPLKSACKMQAGKFVQASDISEAPREGLFPCYGGNGLRGYTKTFTHTGKYPLIGRQGALCGNVKLVTGDIHATEHAVVATVRTGIDVDWLFYTLELANLNQYATGQAQPGVSVEVLDKVLIALPPVEAEQQKIAECLSTLDELIGAESQKLDALKAHKKGLMQQLFPREGETLPRLRLRFPEFHSAPEWNEVPLGSYIEEFRAQSSTQDEFEVLTSARGGLVRQREYYDNDRITERDNIGFNIIPPNYVTYRSRSDDRRFYFNENKLGITGIVSIYYPVFRIVNGSNKFFIELLEAFSRLVGKYSVGTSQTVLSLNQLARIKLPIPSEPEQHRIATCLSSLDDLIAAQSDRLSALQTHKQGLLQQLFPSPADAHA